MITEQLKPDKYKTLFSKIGHPYKVFYNRNDYSNDPFFIKSADDSQKMLAKVGFPKEVLEQMGLAK